MTSKSRKAPDDVWQPRIDEESEFNAFTNDHRPDDDQPLSGEIPDARVDTAPLEGSRDLSDDDSVVIDGARGRQSEETEGPTVRGPLPH